MTKVASANAPPSAAGKPRPSMFKIPSVIAILAAISAVLYAKFMMDTNTNVDPSKFPLGRYPLAYQVTKGEFYELIGNKLGAQSARTAEKYPTTLTFYRSVDAFFKDLTQKFPISEHLVHNIAFATVELGKSRELFQELQIQTAPWLMFFKASPAGIAPPAPVAFNIKRPMNQESVLGFISENLGAKISLKRQRTTAQKMGFAAGAIAVLGLSAIGITGKLGNFIYNPWLTMVFSTLFIVAMNSGYMFCKVRGLPISFYSYAPSARFAPAFQAQTGAEMWIVGSLTLMNAFATVILGAAVPKIQHPIGKRVAALIFVCVMMFGFDTQLQIFKKKFPSYPYKLFL